MATNRANLEWQIPDWPTVDISQFSLKDQRRFNSRKTAVEQRKLGEKRPAQIYQETGIRASENKRRQKECETLHPDGLPWGYRALLPNRKKKYQRRGPPKGAKSLAGMWTWLLQSFAGLEPYLTELSTKGEQLANGTWQRVNNDRRHALFLMKCTGLGIGSDQYPFIGGDQAYRALLRWDQDRRKRRSVVNVAPGGFTPTAPGQGVLRGLKRRGFLREVQFDGHELGVYGVVKISTLAGGVKRIPLRKVYAVTAVDVDYSAPIGGHLSLAGSYDQGDVQLALATSLGVWGQPNGQAAKWLPVHEYPQLQWCPAVIYSIDRFLAHRANDISYVVQRNLNSRQRFHKAHTPRARAVIEALNSLLEHRGFQRMPSAVNKHSTKSDHDHAIKMAMSMDITFTDLTELYRRAIWLVLTAPQVKHGNRSTLDAIGDFVAEHAPFMRRVPVGLQEPESVLRYSFTATLRGNIGENRFNHVNHDYGTYVGPQTMGCDEYLGKQLSFLGVLNDARTVKAHFQDKLIDVMHARPPWHETAHTFTMRARAEREAKKAGFKFRRSECGVSQYLAELAKRLETSEGAESEAVARQYERITQQAGISLPPVTPPSGPSGPASAHCEPSRPKRLPLTAAHRSISR